MRHEKNRIALGEKKCMPLFSWSLWAAQMVETFAYCEVIGISFVLVVVSSCMGKQLCSERFCYQVGTLPLRGGQ